MAETALKARAAHFPVKETAEFLAELCRRQDEAVEAAADGQPVEPLTDAFKAVFSDVVADHVRSVDTAQAFATFLHERIGASRRLSKYMLDRAHKDEEALAAFKEVCREAIEAYPDLPWRSTQKIKLYVANNSEASLDTGLKLAKKTISNVLSDHDVSWLPARYVKLASYLVLDTEALKADLAEGKAVAEGWAKLERGKHVRGLVMKLKEVGDGAE
jgi:hypothetical protein